MASLSFCFVSETFPPIPNLTDCSFHQHAGHDRGMILGELGTLVLLVCRGLQPVRCDGDEISLYVTDK